MGCVIMTYVTQYMTWDNIKLAVRFHPDRFPVANQEIDDPMAHLEIHVLEPEKAILPITDTGYKSHFAPKSAILSHGSPAGFVKEWLKAQSQTKLWQSHLERTRQGELF